MLEIHGCSVCGGISRGKIYQLKKRRTVKKRRIEDVRAEEERLNRAIEKCAEELQRLYEKVLPHAGEDAAMIFEMHRMMLMDADFLSSVRESISVRRMNAEAAVMAAADEFIKIFASMEDEYMSARGADVQDISDRLINALTGGESYLRPDVPAIICAADLAPSETVQPDSSKILAFVTEQGSVNSHTSILARTMNIPSVIGAAGIMDARHDGADAIIDGFNGVIYIDPDEVTKETLCPV